MYEAGQKFSRLTLLSTQGKTKGGKTIWICRCNCGAEVAVASSNLGNGHSKSCGCLRAELTSGRVKKHGRTGTREWNAWSHMLARCFNPNAPRYERWGGRGITVCAAWRDNFAQFLADMGECPKGRSLERRDNEGNYDPANCIWADAATQARNRRTSRKVVICGDAINLIDAATRLGIHRNVISNRMRQTGETHQQSTDHFARRAGL